MGFYGSRIPPFAERIPLASAIIYKEGNYAIAKVWNEQWGRWSRIAKSTDHADVIQSAINEIYNNYGGGKILIKKGIYELIKTVFLKSNIRLVGEGIKSILKLVSLPDQLIGDFHRFYTMITNENWRSGGDSNISIENLHLVVEPNLIGTNGYERTVYTASFWGASNVLVRNNMIESCGVRFSLSDNYAYYLKNNFDPHFTNTDCRNVIYENNTILNVVEGLWLDRVDGALVKGNWIETTLDSAMGLHWGGRGYIIVENTILRLKGDPWTPDDVAGASIEITSAFDGHSDAFYQENHVIANNVIKSVNTGYQGEIAFNGYKFKNIRIIGNYIEKVHDDTLSTGTYNGCIHVQGENIVVMGNVCIPDPDTTYAVIRVWSKDSPARNIVISKNIIYGGAKYYGIHVHEEHNTHTTEDVLVEGNIIIGSYSRAGINVYANYGSDYLKRVVVKNNITPSLTVPSWLDTKPKGNIVNNAPTENSGTATIPAGSNKVTVNHGLVDTPSNVYATPLNDPGTYWYIANRNPTTFDIVLASPPSSDVVFSWYAEV